MTQTSQPPAQDSRVARIALVLAVLAVALPAFGSGRNTKILHTFPGSPDGGNPAAGLVADSAGNLYGTTEGGGVFGHGTVFELSPVNYGNGWSYQVIYHFQGVFDGNLPRGGVILDNAGNLYGTTLIGGAHGVGTVFQLSPAQGGGWRETVIHDFAAGSDGVEPSCSLVFDHLGNLYGTASSGGGVGTCVASGCGIVFKLSPKSGGQWKETVLYAFTGGLDGELPFSGVAVDARGHVFGTTNFGDRTLCNGEGCGLVYELAHTPSGWKQTVIYNFIGGNDGASPSAAPILDSAGNLYGVTGLGGSAGGGVVYKLSPSRNGWQETVIHAFSGLDGVDPQGSLVFDSVGNLYGTTEFGGNLVRCGGGCGTVFELSPNGAGGWDESTVRRFVNGKDGVLPLGSVAVDAAGNVYATTSNGGVVNGGFGAGTVVQVTPPLP